MKLGSPTAVTLLAAAIVGVVAVAPLDTQTPPRPRTASAATGSTASWIARADAMLRDGSLDLGPVQGDTMLAGRSHERLVQRHEGLPVFGGQIVRHRDGRAILRLSGRLFEDVSVGSLQPTIDAAEAASIAERHMGGGTAAADTPQLGILARPDRYALVYRVKVWGPLDVRTVSIDARTGAIEQSVSELRRQVPVVGLGTGVLRDSKKVSGIQSGGLFRAVDRLRPTGSSTIDFGGSFGRLNLFFETLGAVTASDIASSTTSTWTDGAVVDAHAYEGWVYDYYFKRFGRQGLDGANIDVISVVHPLARGDAPLYSPDIVGTFINNAIYLHPGYVMYGDGDGRLLDFLAGGFDVVAHELTHGVTAFSSGLDYVDEPGALNEAFSDIMATGAEFFQLRPGQGPQKGPNFLIGEDVIKVAPGYLRSMADPASVGDPDHYSLRQYIGTPIDDGGVHINSSIINHAFYLAVAGGTNRVSGIAVRGIGVANIERMERIFYRAFVFGLGPVSQFSDARAETLAAAAELFGASSDERAQLALAWAAVGVN